MKKGKETLVIDEFIQLRLPRINMALEFFAVIDREREQLREWLYWVDQMQSSVDSQRFLKEANIFNQGGQKLTTFIYFHNQLVGSVGLVQIDTKNKKAEIGYWLCYACQGQGIVTKACQHLMRYAFEHLALHRLEMRIPSSNTASIAVAKRLGFHYEGTHREAILLRNTYHDVEWYSTLSHQQQRAT